MVTQQTLYQEVVVVTERYFGPAADRFIVRQIDSHLHKAPELLKKQDLAKLIRWISLAMAMLVEDEKLISDYAADLQRLVGRQVSK